MHPNEFGYVCPHLEETRQCNTMYCPIDCVVSDWSSWAPFTNGGALVERTRAITTHVEHGGVPCPSQRETRHWHEIHPGCPVVAPHTIANAKLSAWTTCSKACGSGHSHRHAEHEVCSNSAVVRLKLKWKMSRRCNTAPCVSPSALDEEVPRLRGRQVAPSEYRLDEEVGGWKNVRASDVPALLGKGQLEALQQLSAGSDVQWQRHNVV